MQRLSNKIVYFDANIFIYAVETNETMSPYFTIVSHLFELAATRNIAAMTSELTLAEVLVGAYNTNKQPLVKLYEDLISTEKRFINECYHSTRSKTYFRADDCAGLC